LAEHNLKVLEISGQSFAHHSRTKLLQRHMIVGLSGKGKVSIQGDERFGGRQKSEGTGRKRRLHGAQPRFSIEREPSGALILTAI
jgi:hypothetical protein